MKTIIKTLKITIISIAIMKLIHFMFGGLIKKIHLNRQFDEALLYSHKNTDEIIELSNAIELLYNDLKNCHVGHVSTIKDSIYQLQVKLNIALEENDHWLIAIADLKQKLD